MTNFFFYYKVCEKKDYKCATFTITFSLSACLNNTSDLIIVWLTRIGIIFFIKVWLEALKSRPTELSIFWEPHSMTLYLVTSISGRYNRYHQRKILFVYVPQDMSLAFIVKNFSFISEGRKHLTFNRLYLDFMMSELRNISIFFHASFCCPWSLIFSVISLN